MRAFAFVPGCSIVVLLSAASCGSAPERSSERFCGELSTHATQIRSAPETVDDIPAFITLFSKMGEVAPLDVQPDWEQVYESLRTANTVDVGDPASVQAVADAAYDVQRSAENVVAWATTNCGLDLGPVGAVNGGAAVVVPTTAATGSTGGG